jgi:hypothetical protein
MPEADPTTGWVRYVQSALRLFAATTLEGSLCLTAGGIFTCIGVFSGVSVAYLPALQLAGMAIALTPVKLYFSPERVYLRKCDQWETWVKRKRLSKTECEQWKRHMKSWYASQIPAALPPMNPTPMLPALAEDMEDQG